LTLPANLFALFREIISFVPCVAVILLARRLPVVQIRSVRLHYASVVVCAIVLWIGAVCGALGALAACWIDARIFLHARSSRIAAFKSGISLAVAAAAAAFVQAASVPPPDTSLPAARLCLAAWMSTMPVLLTFLCVYGMASLLAGLTRKRNRLQPRPVPAKIRIGLAISGFVPLALVVPIGVFFGCWAAMPLLGLLVAVGLLIHRAFEIARLRTQLSVSQAMGLASLADAATAEPTALLYRFLHLAQNLVHSERSLVWLVNDATDEIIPAVGLPDMGEFAGLRARLGEGLIGAACDRTRPIIVSDVARTAMSASDEPAADSWLLYPIVSQKRVLGVAQWTRPAGTPFSAEDAEQLEALVPQVGVAVESLRYRNKMRELAATDGLTGLLNHRRIGEMLRDEMRRAERYNRPLSVLMLDVDSFKSFNDAYGHVIGDQLLRSVSQLLQSGVRTVDKVGRYGGEEFIIVMPETHKDDAYLLAERIRTAVEEQAYVVIAGEEIHRTISVGVASYPEDGLNPQEVVERADSALYRAKDAGRNCVVWA